MSTGCHHHACSRRAFLQTSSLALLAGCAEGSGLSVPVLLSPQDEASLGHEAWQKILAEQPQSDNRRLKRRIEEVATNIIDATRTGGLNWEFALFENPKVNAFALPGGKVGVYTGLFQVADNDAQLAAVLGHEISHVTAHHAAKRISTQMVGDLGVKLAQVGLQAAGVAGGQQIAGLLGAGVSYGVVLPFSRQQELEADALGLDAMARAGYDPEEAAFFWEKMGKNQENAPKWMEFASTHPSDGRRMQALQAMIPAKKALYEQTRNSI